MFEKFDENLEEYTVEPIVEETDEPEIEFEEVLEDARVGLFPKSCYVVGGNLNLRESPSTDANIIKVLPLGLVLNTCSEKEGDWIKVTDNDSEGWVMTKFLEFEE